MKPSFQDILKLIKAGSTIEAQEKIMQLRIEVMGIQEENLALKSEVQELKAKIVLLESAKKEKPKIQWGCYIFEGDEGGLYCPACYDTKGVKVLTSRVNSKFRRCNVCKAELS